MPASPSSIVDAVSSLIQSAQGGFQLGGSQDAYSAFTNAVNLAGTMAGTGPWATGLNLAATSNNTVTALSNYQNGTLQPTDMLQITSSALSLVVAAAAISGAPITLSALVLAGTIGIVAGPGPLGEAFNEYATQLGAKLASGVFGTTAFNAAELSTAVGGTQGDGQSVVFHQYDIGSGELVTMEFIDRFGVTHGEFGTVTGNARVGVVGSNGTWWTVTDSNENVVRQYFEPSATTTSQHDFTVPMAADSWTNGLDAASDRVAAGQGAWNSGAGNTADYVAGIAAAAGLGYDALSNIFGSTSTTGLFFGEMDWFSQSPEFYQNIWDQGGNADNEADYHLYQLEQHESSLGETELHEDIDNRVGWGIASPIVVDLDGNGLHTSSTEDSGVLFDITGDGVVERTGWIEKGDAFLAVDRNANGRIDDVNELFGGMSRGVGYTELAALDADADGWISATEANVGGLLLWRDADGNGQTDSGELKAASQWLASIGVDYQRVDLLNNGNLIGEVSTALTEDGSVAVGDIYFRYQRLSADADSLVSALAQFDAPSAQALPASPWSAEASPPWPPQLHVGLV